jgi:hypothetical protein
MQSNDNLKDKRDDIELKWNTDNQWIKIMLFYTHNFPPALTGINVCGHLDIWDNSTLIYLMFIFLPSISIRYQ